MDVKNIEHYAYFKDNIRYADDGYSNNCMDYVAFDDIEEMKAHYHRNSYKTGTYVKIMPIKFETTVVVKE